MKTRPAAVADMFYPADASILARQVSSFLSNKNPNPAKIKPIKPKAIIVPHAGYIYSGETAGQGFSLLESCKESIERVVIVAPCHRVWVEGIAIPSCNEFETPLGKIELDLELLHRLQELPDIVVSDTAHKDEHAIEVQLPFLQTILPHVKIVPMVVGDIASDRLTEILNFLWDGDQTLIIVSSDLSHFLDYDSACALDSKTTQAIESFSPQNISPEQACGSVGIKALLKLASQKHLNVKTIAQCNSGDTAGDRNRVVGYASYAIY